MREALSLRYDNGDSATAAKWPYVSEEAIVCGTGTTAAVATEEEEGPEEDAAPVGDEEEEALLLAADEAV